MMQSEKVYQINGLKIDPQLFTYKFGCRCNGECCYYGVYTDKVEHEKILSLKDKLIPLMDETQSKNVDDWFEEPEPDDDFDSGIAVGTEVINGKCTFLDKNGLCVIQALAINEGKHPWDYKPVYCYLFPITVFEKTLTLDDEHIDRLKQCNRSNENGTTIIDFCKAELIRFLGEEGYKELEANRIDYLNNLNSKENV
ncbi:MAG: DUF3109 family protein [Ignavibacteria bacterium]|nr:DUF3109 family protein [Ignavibacteria bacterium]